MPRVCQWPSLSPCSHITHVWCLERPVYELRSLSRWSSLSGWTTHVGASRWRPPPISARFTVFLLKNVSGGCFSGYWCGDEFSGRVVECAPPQTARCRGWSTNRGLTVCGPCYLQSSPKCSRCANSCFENFGACYPCQFRADLPPFVAVAVSFAPVLATVAGFGLLHMFAMAISSRPRSPKRRNMARRAVLQGVGPLLVRLGRYSFC